MLFSFLFGRTSSLRSGAKAADVAFSSSLVNPSFAGSPSISVGAQKSKVAAPLKEGWPRVARALMVAGALALGLGAGAPDAGAQTRQSAIRADAGFNANALPRNDDGSSTASTGNNTGGTGSGTGNMTFVSVPIGFPVNFFGNTYDNVFVNNNGNITFDQSLSDYTPFNLTSTGTVIVAPYFVDVDTRGTGGQPVRYGQGTANGRAAFAANYIDVGYFSSHFDKLNSFQVVLIDRSDTGTGNFDIELNYDKIQYEAGDLSGGTNGLGGSTARVGFSNGSGDPGTSFEFPGSARPGAFLDSNRSTGLIYNSFNSSLPGRYIFEVRGGVVGGRYSVANVGVVEGNPGESNVASFTVTLTPPAAIDSSVQYATADGTATAGSDYTATSGTLNFAVGESTKTVTVPITGDLLREGDETFLLNLSNPAGGTFARGQAIGTIFDEEANTPPTARDIARNISEDATLSLSLGTFNLGYSDPDGDPLVKIKIVSLPRNGTLKLGGAAVTANQVVLANQLSTLIYTPSANYFGTDSFVYQNNDRIAYSNTANVNIVVDSVNDPPTISTISNVRINRNTSTGPLDFTIGDVETAPSALMVSAASDNPSVVAPSGIVLGGTDADRTITVTPLAGQIGIANITVSVSDGEATTTSTFVVTVNGAPILADSSFTITVGRPFFSQLTASDPNNDPLTYQVISPKLPNGLTLSTAGLISGTPTQAGSFAATVQVDDGADRVTARVFFTVAPAPLNHPPIVDNQTISVSLNQPLSLQLSGSDPDGDTLTYVVAGNSALPPQLTISPRGVLSGIPTQAGQFYFSLTVSDGKGGVVRANYLLIVTSASDGQGPILTRSAVPQTLTRAQLAAITLSGTVRDVAPAGVTPSGVNRMLYQLRRSLDGYAFNGQAFTPDVNLGYVAIPIGISSDPAATLPWSQSLSVLPGDSVLVPGRYSISILAQDNAGNYGITVIYVNVSASGSVALLAPSGGGS